MQPAKYFNVGHSPGQSNASFRPEAVKWYRMAADQGLVAAQYNLGLKYERGEGVGRDHGEAVKWFRKAADQGYGPAREMLRKLAVQ